MLLSFPDYFPIFNSRIYGQCSQLATFFTFFANPECENSRGTSNDSPYNGSDQSGGYSVHDDDKVVWILFAGRIVRVIPGSFTSFAILNGQSEKLLLN